MQMNRDKIKIQGKEVEIYAEHPVRVVCMEHVEQEIDDYVNEYETAPDTFRLADVEDPELGDTCAVCGAKGAIVLLHVKGM